MLPLAPNGTVKLLLDFTKKPSTKKTPSSTDTSVAVPCTSAFTVSPPVGKVAPTEPRSPAIFTKDSCAGFKDSTVVPARNDDP